MKFGIDVSHWQGIIDWKKVAAQDEPKIDFAFFKASQGIGYRDPKLQYNSHEAREAGIPMIGYYHFATLDSVNVMNDAKKEALHFLDTISTMPPADLPLILDIEQNKANLNDHQVVQWIDTFFGELQDVGYSNYALYSYTPFLNAVLPINHGLQSLKLWIAAYVNKPKPVLPVGWNDYWIWQYSDKGKVAGIAGPVDMNKTYKL